MRAEEQCKPWERYLFADTYFSDSAIAIWQNECVQRCKDKPKGDEYERYVSWKRRENEIAAFTLYAYADFVIPKDFDVIFQTDKPDNFVKVEYKLTQSILEAWLPLDSVSHGHKHLCVFHFENIVPPIFELLHKEKEKFSTSPNTQTRLGFCTSSDFVEIKKEIERQLDLKQRYGDKWWEFDDQL